MAVDPELTLQRIREALQKIAVRYSEYWTLNDTRAFDRALQEVGHIERKIKTIKEGKKVSI